MSWNDDWNNTYSEPNNNDNHNNEGSHWDSQTQNSNHSNDENHHEGGENHHNDGFHEEVQEDHDEVAPHKDGEFSLEELTTSMDAAHKEFLMPPSNITAELVFSEKDIFYFYNVMKALESCGETVTGWVYRSLGLKGATNATLVRRIINIIQIDGRDFRSKAAPLETLKKIGVLADPPNGQDPILLTIDTINLLNALSEQELRGMVALVRILVGEETARKIKSGGGDVIVRHMVPVFKMDPELKEKIAAIDTVLSVLAKAMDRS